MLLEARVRSAELIDSRACVDACAPCGPPLDTPRFRDRGVLRILARNCIVKVLQSDSRRPCGNASLDRPASPRRQTRGNSESSATTWLVLWKPLVPYVTYLRLLYTVIFFAACDRVTLPERSNSFHPLAFPCTARDRERSLPLEDRRRDGVRKLERKPESARPSSRDPGRATGNFGKQRADCRQVDSNLVPRVSSNGDRSSSAPSVISVLI